MRIVIDKGVEVPMRDGVTLSTDVYRPDGGSSFPTLLTRTPYNKDLPRTIGGNLDVLRAVRAGYAVVVQDTRGRYASEGTFNPFFDEANDGADTVEWAAAQEWSDGNVGMFGASYFGATQWTAATQAPAALRAIAPYVTGDQYYDGWAYQGGAFQLGFNLHWTLSGLGLGEVLRKMGAGEAAAADFSALVAAIDDNERLYRRLPLANPPELKGLSPYYDDWLAHPSYDEFWRATAPRESYGKITVPALNMGGWYDLFLKGTLANYIGMKEHGSSPLARRQRLVIGPWSHGASGGWYPDRSYGVMSGTDTADITGMQLRWFDWLLRGQDNGVESEAPVRIFVMGANVWRDEADWPLPDTEYVDFFLHSGGRANTSEGDGGLSVEFPGDEAEDVYLYDPRDPVPTVGGGTFLPGLGVGVNAGPRDQRQVETRHDVLCYTTPPLAAALEVTGPVLAVLHVSSSAADTDFTAKLVDVHPDGRAESVADGILRARYRESLSAPRPLEPGRIYEVIVDLVATSNVFDRGHRIRLEVSSSNFPRFDRNTNTGGVIAEEGEDVLVQAVNRVHHSSAHASRLILPLIRR
jgi:uncharacterized protein